VGEGRPAGKAAGAENGHRKRRKRGDEEEENAGSGHEDFESRLRLVGAPEDTAPVEHEMTLASHGGKRPTGILRNTVGITPEVLS